MDAGDSVRTGAAGRRRARWWLAAVAAVAVAGCGGGGDDDAPPPWSGVTIEQPTEAPTYATSASSVTLAGRSFVPDGSSCPAIVGVIAPGYAVRWRNTATGDEGVAALQLNCLLAVSLTWRTGAVPLAAGDNVIVVTATSQDGRTGSAMLTVARSS